MEGLTTHFFSIINTGHIILPTNNWLVAWISDESTLRNNRGGDDDELFGMTTAILLGRERFSLWKFAIWPRGSNAGKVRLSRGTADCRSKQVDRGGDLSRFATTTTTSRDTI